MNKQTEGAQENGGDKTLINISIDAESWETLKALIDQIDQAVNKGGGPIDLRFPV